MGDYATFGIWLKRLRQERGLTQDDLAEQTGCATQTIRKIEGGHRRPSYQMATRLAQVLALSAAEHTAWMRAAREEPEQAAPTLVPSEQAPRTQARSLPTYLTPLVGRAREAAEVVHQLNQPSCRLLTILGPGGTGKTRLALQVAIDVQAQATREVAFVPLAQVMAIDEVAVAIAYGLGCPLSATATAQESLLAFLRDRPLLLVLDNLEHVLDAAPLLAALLREAPGVQLLATSRERLRLHGEQVFELSGLATPHDESRLAIDRSDAVLLFVKRARHIAGDFALTPHNRAAVATICRLVDGMPLGIELAAAWVRILSPEEIVTEIARSLDFLTLSDRDADQRHRSMRAVLDQSWALLTPEEQFVLARLSSFRGGCTREAAEAVAGATLPVLAGLRDKSLTRRSGEGRYELHELVRQYAAEHLAADPSALANARAQHCAYYTDWLAARTPMITSSQQPAVVADITGEIDNIRAVWQYGIEQRDVQQVWRLAGMLWFYEVRGWYQEAALMCRRAADAIRTPATREEEQLLGTLTGMQGWFTFRRGQTDAGMRLLEQSVSILAPGDHSRWLFSSLVQIGYVTLFRGEFERAAGFIEQLAQLAQQINDPWRFTHLFIQQGALYVDRAPELAYARFHERLPYIRARGDRYLLAMSLNYLGDAALTLGHVLEAEQLFTEARASSAEMDNGITEVVALTGLASVALAREAWVDAVRYALHAVARAGEVGEIWSRAKALVVLGEAERSAGDYTAARGTLHKALQHSLASGLLSTALEAWAELASLDLHQQARRPALVTLLACVPQHPATNVRTAARVAQLWALLAADGDVATMAEAEGRARLIQRDQLIAQLTAYIEGRLDCTPL